MNKLERRVTIYIHDTYYNLSQWSNNRRSCNVVAGGPEFIISTLTRTMSVLLVYLHNYESPFGVSTRLKASQGEDSDGDGNGEAVEAVTCFGPWIYVRCSRRTFKFNLTHVRSIFIRRVLRFRVETSRWEWCGGLDLDGEVIALLELVRIRWLVRGCQCVMKDLPLSHGVLASVSA